MTTANRKPSQWRPALGTEVLVSMPDGRTLHTKTYSDILSGGLVAVYGLNECVLISQLSAPPEGTPPLKYERERSPFGPWEKLVPRWLP